MTPTDRRRGRAGRPGMSPKQAAILLDMSEPTVRRRCDLPAGHPDRIPSMRFGTDRRITQETVDEILRLRDEEAAATAAAERHLRRVQLEADARSLRAQLDAVLAELADLAAADGDPGRTDRTS